MSVQVHLLAVHGNDQMVVYYPDSSVVRLVSKRTTLRFTSDEFHSLIVAFEWSHSALDVTDGAVRLTQHEEGDYELSIGEVCLRLPLVDYLMLGRTLEGAWHRLAHGHWLDATAVPPAYPYLN